MAHVISRFRGSREPVNLLSRIPRIIGLPMEWWIWLAAGLVLVVAELATPGGFVIIFFGISALVVGVIALLGGVTSSPLQFLLFSVLAVGSLAILRGRLQSRLQTPPSSMVDSLIGDLAIPQERLSPGVVGRVEVRGST